MGLRNFQCLLVLAISLLLFLQYANSRREHGAFKPLVWRQTPRLSFWSWWKKLNTPSNNEEAIRTPIAFVPNVGFIGIDGSILHEYGVE